MTSSVTLLQASAGVDLMLLVETAAGISSSPCDSMISSLFLFKTSDLSRRPCATF